MPVATDSEHYCVHQPVVYGRLCLELSTTSGSYSLSVLSLDRKDLIDIPFRAEGPKVHCPVPGLCINHNPL